MAFVVVASDGEYAFLSDGKKRPLEKPKKKKIKHIQKTNVISNELREKFLKKKVLNADVKKFIRDNAKEERVCQKAIV